MRISLIAPGSRGDVQPYIALGKGLKQAGNDVRLVSHQDFEELVESHGLEFWPMAGNVQDIVQSKEMRERVEKGNFIALMSEMAEKAKDAAVVLAKDALAACQGVDLLVGGMGGLYAGLAIAEKLDLPLLQAYVFPFTPTRAFPSVLMPKSLPLPGFFNRLSHHLTRQFMWQGFRAADGVMRKEVLGVPEAPFFGPYSAELLHRLPTLYGLSPSVIQKPPDWDASVHLTGYWFLDSASDWEPPPGLTEFLQKDPQPVYIGFGSMANRKPEETAELVLQALAQIGQRAVILSGWGGMHKEDLPDSVFMLESIPHAWLFPRVAAIVHHGGAGTTAAGLRAGVPSLVIPFFGDQPFWGQRIAALGVGPEPIPRKKLTAERLAQAIQTAVTDETMRRRAADLGAKIQAEDGVARAVSIIQQAMEEINQ